MRKEVTRIIEGQEYTFYALPATQSFSTLAKISKLLCSTLGAGLDTGGNSVASLKSLLSNDFNPSKALQSFSQRLDEKEVLEIALLFFVQISHKGKGQLNSKEIVDVHFAGQVFHMMKVFSAALSIEYADFFAEGQGLRNIISRAKENLAPGP
jgi:hypothetical protein